MQEWLSIAVGVLLMLLTSGTILWKYSQKHRNCKSVIPDGSLKNNQPIDAEPPKIQELPVQETCERGVVISRDKHPISRKNISKNALKVLHRLTSSGYDAYLVGGCIRDLYLGLTPKDFDVTTNATPEEVRRLFRNSRVIGRRFKLVHILFGRETIEVATFRAGHSSEVSVSERSRHSDSGRILRDNVYGSREDDALRRDFTVNALYYESRNFTVIDYCDGINHLYNKKLQLIGDARLRYHEDPVRMLRAIRFAVKLDFDIAVETAEPIQELAALLRDIPAARLFDESLKLLQSGRGVETFKLLRKYGLLQHLFPLTDKALKNQDTCFEKLLYEALKSTDARILNEKPVTPAFLFAALLWRPLQRLARTINKDGIPAIPAFQQAATKVLEDQVDHTAIPKRFSMKTREIWELQARLERRQPRTIVAILEHQRFRAAYDFLILRDASGENLKELCAWWTSIQEINLDKREEMIAMLRRNNK